MGDPPTVGPVGQQRHPRSQAAGDAGQGEVLAGATQPDVLLAAEWVGRASPARPIRVQVDATGPDPE